MIAALATLFLIGYAFVCIAAGLVGVAIPSKELATVFNLSLTGMEAGAAATFLAHYRFLKAMEVVFGLFILLFRRDILDGAQPWLIFFAGCALGIAARAGGWWIDGAPSWPFMGVLVSEIITLALVFVAARRDRGQG